MKQKEFQKISLIKNPYYIFTREENAHPRGYIDLKSLESPKQKTVYNKKFFINPLIHINQGIQKYHQYQVL